MARMSAGDAKNAGLYRSELVRKSFLVQDVRGPAVWVRDTMSRVSITLIRISIHMLTPYIIHTVGLLMYGSLKARLQKLYIHTIDIHTIKYEWQSLVVGDGVAYKRFFKPISPCKNNWQFVGRSETISSRRITHVRYQVTQTVIVASESFNKFSWQFLASNMKTWCHAPDCQEVTYGEVCATTECILCKMFYYK